MGKRPSHEGTVTVKDGDTWKKVGECAGWVTDGKNALIVMTVDGVKSALRFYFNDDNSVSGSYSLGEIQYNFRAWKR